MTKNKTINGVAGWLRFLIGMLLVGGLYYLLAGVRRLRWGSLVIDMPEFAHNKMIKYTPLADTVTDLFSAGVFLYAAYLLLKKREYLAVKTVKWIIGLVIPLLIIVSNFVSPIVFFDDLLIDLVYFDTEPVKALVSTLLWSAVWVTYLHRSVRVRNTYH